MLVNVCVGELFPHVLQDLDIIQRLKAQGQYWLTNEEWSGWDSDSRLEINQLVFLSVSLFNSHIHSLPNCLNHLWMRIPFPERK